MRWTTVYSVRIYKNWTSGTFSFCIKKRKKKKTFHVHFHHPELCPGHHHPYRVQSSSSDCCSWNKPRASSTLPCLDIHTGTTARTHLIVVEDLSVLTRSKSRQETLSKQQQKDLIQVYLWENVITKRQPNLNHYLIYHSFIHFLPGEDVCV